MTEKEKLTARLKELGEKLGRDVITSGTSQELAMRIAELEEELDDEQADDGDAVDSQDDEHQDTDSNTQEADKSDTDTDTDTGSPAQQGDLVQVKTLVTLHIDALHATRNELVSIVEPGVIIRVSGKEADNLSSRKLVRKL
ncbi:TPA: DNA-packaging protein FI [Enterobacter ludwigii]